ncbi:MAG: adenine phosphoribosyltransferase [Candidatus Poseidoniia archaeon]|jgi:adenine phosphoribosyltransferase|nr:adenine phosphoribosyltransferase [Candidatus Poseidoniia archaeon]MEE1543904.1 adenine phosphoribosyltransferase [Alphaproteobacteria bacterium]MDP7081909.1 adenine phosphoribosyltransferase [Candidatus Poseidoniia archaeon]MDP7255534.1 adenine phosphoribosyltransferase [Candidatus Poseidoniia archaeon]MDP7473551.1 adenine phosphoribosyltransferase [Candidatus Poseidoniia archaeon]|tara:strand:+ start:687 stop:1244 length:558 start_codon:yes stop_codon:yes gene_type:complete
MAGLELLRASLAESLIVSKGEYQYFVHPLSDGVPLVEAAILDEAAAALAARVPPESEILVTAEAIGLPLAAAVTLRTGLPYTTLRKRAYGLPGERVVTQKTGYGGAELHLNAPVEGKHVTIVDDVLSTGGTLRAMCSALTAAGALIDRVLIVFSKVDPAELSTELGVDIKVLLQVHVEGAKVIID